MKKLKTQYVNIVSTAMNTSFLPNHHPQQSEWGNICNIETHAPCILLEDIRYGLSDHFKSMSDIAERISECGSMRH